MNVRKHQEPNIAARFRTTYGRSRAVRHADFDYASPVDIHLVLCALCGRPFASPSHAAVVSDSIMRSCELCGYRLYGFCLMPDHLHVLLNPTDSGVRIADWLRRFKSYTTNTLARAGGPARLWQRSAYDHVCRSEETAENVLRYIIENPVRAGLVENWEAWPWTRVFIEL